MIDPFSLAVQRKEENERADGHKDPANSWSAQMLVFFPFLPPVYIFLKKMKREKTNSAGTSLPFFFLNVPAESFLFIF